MDWIIHVCKEHAMCHEVTIDSKRVAKWSEAYDRILKVFDSCMSTQAPALHLSTASVAASRAEFADLIRDVAILEDTGERDDDNLRQFINNGIVHVASSLS